MDATHSFDIRVRALELANNRPVLFPEDGTPTSVVERAELYELFLRGEYKGKDNAG